MYIGTKAVKIWLQKKVSCFSQNYQEKVKSDTENQEYKESEN